MNTSEAAASNNGQKNAGQVCVLSDGSRIRFTLKRRARDPFYLVYFRGPDGKPREKSTKEVNKRRATDSAIVTIREDYAPKVPRLNPSWDEAVETMVSFMKADNLRPGTVKQYEYVVGTLRKLFPEAHSPADITPAMAQRLKVLRLKDGAAPRTVAGNIGNLNIIYGHWWRDTCKLVSDNPFQDVQPPKADKHPPRIISAEEEQAFLSWLACRWRDWRFPAMFLEVKKVTGCRIGELAKAPTTNLRDGRLYFEAATTKGRKQRAVKLPSALYDELRAVAGTKFVFGEFTKQLRAIHRKRGKPGYATMVGEFRPERLVNWLEDQTTNYFKKNPEAKRFKLHNFRGTAMSRARMAGVSFDDAAVAFGCNPETMRQHYIALEEQEITDRVMDQIQSKT